MRDVTRELARFASDRSGKFALAHESPALIESLLGFLGSRMDQVRIFHALKTSEKLLELIDAEDIGVFIRAVLRRERENAISYPLQRDHTYHTVYNYLLGWYIYDNSSVAKINIANSFKNRGISENLFSEMWIYVSLLHDIGYIFEGSFNSTADCGKDIHFCASVNAVKDYFNTDFWKFYHINEKKYKESAESAGLIWPFQLDDTNLETLGRSLQKLGPLNRLVSELNWSLKTERTESYRGDIQSLPASAFGIWKANYNYYGMKNIAGRIDNLESEFYKLATTGFKVDGRDTMILNHGVCSGIILLSLVTYFFCIHSAVGAIERDQSDIIQDLRNLCDDYTQLNDEINAPTWWWWSALVWATGATAFHDLHHRISPKDKLSIKDDPIAYLGILVDELQVWDRFSVKDPVFDPYLDHNQLPLQSSEVKLAKYPGGKKILFAVPKIIYLKLKRSLDERLDGWDNIVLLSEQ